MDPGTVFRRILFSHPARRAWLVAFAALTIVVLTLALTPLTRELPSSGWDKFDHAAAFAVLAFCGLYAGRHRASVTVELGIGLLALGAAIEVAQRYVPGRTADWRDVVADGLGIALGLALARVVAKKLDRRTRPRPDS